MDDALYTPSQEDLDSDLDWEDIFNFEDDEAFAKSSVNKSFI